MPFPRALLADTSVPRLLRAVLGGTLMGLANLVPGISGGTMLLAAGIYPQFISGIAEVTTFRFRVPTMLLLGAIAGFGGTRHHRPRRRGQGTCHRSSVGDV